MTGLIAELRRRKVFRVVALYVVGAWVVIQVAGEAFEAWDIPEQSLRYVWIAAILGFPFALFAGWRYDFIDGRIVRTRPADPSRPEDLSLKGADYAVIAVLIIATAAAAFGIYQRASDTTDRVPRAGPLLAKSIAVLPFDNLSGDASAEPFAAGIHDDILTHIAKISDLKVISRTSVSRIDPAMPVREIGKLLHVGSVLEGGVQRAGNQLRINVQLIDAATDEHLWAESFDRELSTENIFAIQTEIAEAVARALEINLSTRDQESLTRIPTDNFEAYEAYLYGGQQLATRTTASLEAARDSFATAVSLDPDFALAHVGLANAYLLLNNYGALQLDEALLLADASLERALGINPGLAAAHASIGLSFTRQQRTDEAAAAYERAIALDPNYAPAFHWYGDTLMFVAGDLQGALALLERARDLDPLSPVINITLGEVYNWLGRFDDARAQFEKVRTIDPEYPTTYFQLAILERFVNGRLDESVRLHIEELRRDPASPGTGLAFAFMDLGDLERARQWTDRAMAIGPDWFWPVAAKSQLHRFLGEADDAVRYAEQLNEIMPGNNMTLVTLVSFGRDGRVIELAAEHWPELSCDDPVVTHRELHQAINVSLAIERSGDRDCAGRLLDAALDALDSVPRLGPFGYGFADAEIYARQGDTELALDAFRRAIDEGVRGWWYGNGPASPHNASVVDDPRFVAMMDEVRAEMAQQLDTVIAMEARGELDLPDSEKTP